jgi:hypothetical protein
MPPKKKTVKKETAKKVEDKVEEPKVEDKKVEEPTKVEKVEDKKEETKTDGADKVDWRKLPRKRKAHVAPASDENRPKRERKSIQAEAYQPQDFTSGGPTVQIFRGRGKKLRDIDTVKESINSHSMNSEEVAQAHRFLYTMRGRVARREMKSNILEFSGYLKHIQKGVDEKVIEKDDEDDEVRLDIIDLDPEKAVLFDIILAHIGYSLTSP